jgi:hypothetical protein
MKVKNNLGRYDSAQNDVVWDSSAVRRLFVRLAGAVGHQSALHEENMWQMFENESQMTKW